MVVPKRGLCVVVVFGFLLVAQELLGECVAAEVELIPIPPVHSQCSNWAGMHVDQQGRVYVTSGDHRKLAGNSWLYRYDPRVGKLCRLIDIQIQGAQNYNPLGVGHGKFHAPPVLDGKGRIWLASTYYNEPSDDVANYQGSLLFSVSPSEDDRVLCHGVAFPGEGVFAATFLRSIGAYAALTLPSGRLQIFDVGTRRVVFQSPQRGGMQVRLLAKDDRDRVYFNDADGHVFRYVPELKRAEPVPIDVPSSRASWHSEAKPFTPKDDLVRIMKCVSPGVFLGITRYGFVFKYDIAKRNTRILTHALDRDTPPGPYYVADIAISADGKRAYYVGGTGNSSGDYHHDNPVIELAIDTGAKRVLCRLNQVLGQKAQARFRWNFAAALSMDEKSLYLCPDVAGDRVFLAVVPVAEEGG